MSELTRIEQHALSDKWHGAVRPYFNQGYVVEFWIDGWQTNTVTVFVRDALTNYVASLDIPKVIYIDCDRLIAEAYIQEVVRKLPRLTD